jgi:hypothetical protein
LRTNVKYSLISVSPRCLTNSSYSTDKTILNVKFIHSSFLYFWGYGVCWTGTDYVLLWVGGGVTDNACWGGNYGYIIGYTYYTCYTY